MEHRLAQAARRLPFSFLALLPEDTRDGGSPYAMKLGAYLDRLAKEPPETLHKWRSGVLLLSYPSWFFQAFGNVPWSVMKSLAAAQKQSGGVLTLPDLWPAAELTEPQLDVLSHTFPEASAVESWRGVIGALHRRPDLWSEMQSPEGVRPQTLLPLLPPKLAAQLGDLTRAARMRLVKEQHLDARPPWRLYLLEARSREGTRLGVVGVRLDGKAPE